MPFYEQKKAPDLAALEHSENTLNTLNDATTYDYESYRRHFSNKRCFIWQANTFVVPQRCRFHLPQDAAA